MKRPLKSDPTADTLMRALSGAMEGLVRSDDRDLTMRGLSILLMAKTAPGPHTVRGLAAHLETSKPSVTRTLDRLELLGLAQRVRDPSDGRSVLISTTKAGAAYVADVGRLAGALQGGSAAGPRARR